MYSRKEPKRYYPNDTLAAHVLGFVGTDEIGLGGVEQYYNEKIRGEAGKVYLEHDRDRQAFDSYEVQPHPGQTVVLTIDQVIQYRTEQALNAAVERSHAKSGTAIVMDPHTGEILALANAPTFDPNQSRISNRRGTEKPRVTGRLRAWLDFQGGRLLSGDRERPGQAGGQDRLPDGTDYCRRAADS